MELIGTAVTVGTVVQLAVQLGSGALKLHKAIQSIKSAPQEIEALREDLSLFRTLLDEVATIASRQEEPGSALSPPPVLYQALRNCKGKVAYLEALFAD